MTSKNKEGLSPEAEQIVLEYLQKTSLIVERDSSMQRDSQSATVSAQPDPYEYSIASSDLTDLTAKLHALIDYVFKKSDWRDSRTCQTMLNNAVTGVLLKDSDALYARAEKLQKHLNSLLTFLDKFNNYLDSSTSTAFILSSFWNSEYADRCYSLTKTLLNIVNKPLRDGEWAKSGAEQYMLRKKAFLTLRVDLLSPTLQEVVKGMPDRWNTTPDRPNCKQDQLRQKNAEKREREEKERLLDSFSPDLTAAYRLVEDLTAEATGLGDALTVEDEYFVEQTKSDYIPEIIAALKKAEGTSVQFQNKEAMVGEAMKQFRILHAGLHRIIEKGVQQQVDGMQAQTDFLTRKVLGDSSLTLTKDEAWEIVEGDASEAERVRDALYQKHVAPVLEANREDYERRLQAERMRFDATVRAHQRDVETARNRWKEAEGRAKASRERNADLEDRFDVFYAKYKKLDADYKQLSEEQTETLAGFKTALDLIASMEEQVTLYKELTASHDGDEYLTEDPMGEDPDDHHSTHTLMNSYASLFSFTEGVKEGKER